MLTEKQQELWDFLRKYIDISKVFPTLKTVAQHFNISEAAVSRRIDNLAKKGRLIKDPALGFLLLNQDDSVYHGKHKRRYHNNPSVELYLVQLDDYIKMNESNLIFQVKDDFLEQCSINSGDLLEVQNIKIRQLKIGDLVVVRSGMEFFVRLYLVSQWKHLINIGISNKLNFDKVNDHKNIVGRVVRVSRRLSVGNF